MHVHVGVRDGERAIHILNVLISYLPHLLALSASSPFWGGTDTGLASSRMAVLESFPTGGLPYYFPDWKGFQKYYETLIATGAIGSIKDLYWDIRPHFDFGTLEIRVCDGLPTFRETLALVALIHCLVVWIDDGLDRQLRSPHIHMQQYWLAPENKWQATRYGLDGMIVAQESSERMQIRDAVKLLLQELNPIAQSLHCVDELESIFEILESGPSAVRQRQIFAKTGSHRNIVESLIKEFQQER